MTPQELEALLTSETRKHLLSTARRLTGSTADAEDLVQVTFLKAYNNAEKFDGAHLTAWLNTILRNEFTNSWRQTGRHEGVVVSAETSIESLHDLLSADLSPSAETVALWDTFSDEVKSAWSHLPREYAEAIYLVDICQYSYKECAEALSIKLGTVMSRIGRGREILRKNLVRA